MRIQHFRGWVMCMDEAMMERGCGGVDDVYRWGEGRVRVRVRMRARVCV